MESLAPVQFEQIQVGRVFHASDSFGHSEMDQFAALSGDHSAIHADAETAKRFGFPDRVQYGFLLVSLLSRIVGTNRNPYCTRSGKPKRFGFPDRVQYGFLLVSLLSRIVGTNFEHAI